MKRLANALLFVAMIVAAPAAFAQPGSTDPDQPGEANADPDNAPDEHSDKNLPGVDDKTGANSAEGTPGGEVDSDPTEHFNFFNFGYRGKDEWGDKYGDGVMRDPKTGKVALELKDQEEIDPATGQKHVVRVTERKEEEAMSPPFILMLVNFGLLLLILGKWGWPVARKLAQDRHDQIKTALDEAAKLREQAQKKLSEYEDRIKGLDSEVKKLVDDIRAAAESDKKRILENAERQSAQMKKDAEARIAAEIDIARATLAREVAVAAASATEKLLREKVTQDDQSKLVSAFIGSVETAKTLEKR